MRRTDRIDSIKQAVRTLLLEKGDRFTIKDLAEATNTSVGRMYLYYTSKEAAIEDALGTAVYSNFRENLKTLARVSCKLDEHTVGQN